MKGTPYDSLIEYSIRDCDEFVLVVPFNCWNAAEMYGIGEKGNKSS